MTEGEPRPEAVFRRSRVVRREDLDLLEHVNNVVWVRFVVELAEAHSTALGLDFEACRRIGGLWIVRSHEIHYERSAALGARIEESTWVAAMRGARSVRESRFRAGGPEGPLLVRATTHWAYADAETFRPRRIPREVRERFEEAGEEAGPA